METTLEINVHAGGNVHVWACIEGHRILHHMFTGWAAALYEVRFDLVSAVHVRIY